MNDLKKMEKYLNKMAVKDLKRLCLEFGIGKCPKNKKLMIKYLLSPSSYGGGMATETSTETETGTEMGTGTGTGTGTGGGRLVDPRLERVRRQRVDIPITGSPAAIGCSPQMPIMCGLDTPAAGQCRVTEKQCYEVGMEMSVRKSPEWMSQAIERGAKQRYNIPQYRELQIYFPFYFFGKRDARDILQDKPIGTYVLRPSMSPEGLDAVMMTYVTDDNNNLTSVSFTFDPNNPDLRSQLDMGLRNFSDQRGINLISVKELISDQMLQLSEQVSMENVQKGWTPVDIDIPKGTPVIKLWTPAEITISEGYTPFR